VSDPTWGNHHSIFKKAGLTTKTYRYLSKDMGLDFDGMCADLQGAKEGDVFVFHTVQHSPMRCRADLVPCLPCSGLSCRG